MRDFEKYLAVAEFTLITKDTEVTLLKENLKVYEAIVEAKKSGKRAAVATVIKVIGSS